MNDLNVGMKSVLDFYFLHEKELEKIEQIKEIMCKEHGHVNFNLEKSPSSGEMFAKFYELHVINNN